MRRKKTERVDGGMAAQSGKTRNRTGIILAERQLRPYLPAIGSVLGPEFGLGAGLKPAQENG